MEVSDLVLVQGLRDTRTTLAAWNRQPARVLGTWALGSLGVAVVLLCATWFVAKAMTPDPSGTNFPGLNAPATAHDVAFVLYRNSLVLALHAFACVAGFIAGSSLPLSASRYKGWWRWVHDKAGPLAIGFVVAATLFSLSTQAFILGWRASTLSAELHISPLLLIVGLLPHALPELFALFLPLAAWTIASRRNQWHELLAATFVTVAIAVPILIAASLVEVYVSPHLLISLSS